MKIEDVIGGTSRLVVTVDPGDTIADAVDLLKEHLIGAVVVSVDNKSIVGIMSERDVVRHLAHEQEGTLRLSVADLMTHKVSTCVVDDDAEATMALMTAGRFRHMPIVDNDGELCGIVSLGDLVAARLRQLEKENTELLRDTAT